MRVLSLDVMSGAMGFVVLEERERLVDWGVKQGRRSDPKSLLRHLATLLELYRPQVVTIEDCSRKPCRRSLRVRNLLVQLRALAIERGVRVSSVAWSEVRQQFLHHGAYTKDQIARAVAECLPVLIGRLPPKRKPWASEDVRMGIFDAAAFALTFLSQAPPSSTS